MGRPSRRFPHLLPPDVPVWERFLAKYGSQYERIDYDVRVGYGRDPGPNFSPNLRTMGILLSQRRIDAVGITHSTIDIIEITANAGLKAIGQLSAYPALYRDTYHPTKPLRAVLVTESLQSDIKPVLDHTGILYFILPPS